MVLGISAAKSLVEDWKRHKGDWSLNHMKTKTLKNGIFVETDWKSVVVGDVIMLGKNEQIPADIVILSTSNPDSECYIETKNLDGESNLKTRFGQKSLKNINPNMDFYK